MTVFNELKRTKDKVKTLLEKYASLRDDDNKLVSSFIFFELGKHKLESISGHQLLNLMANKKVTQSSSILRARRSLQAEFPELRGKSYKARKENEYDIRKRIKNEY
jgi:hypothetical protein|tara:strand:+ start:973 stop:1290 length:318 start_codon:yes stop_codon:yes gene_type:complete